MIRILNEIIEILRGKGHDINAVIGSRWLVSQNSNQDGILFMFELMKYEDPTPSTEETHRLRYFIGSPTPINNTYVVENIEVVEYIELLHKLFKNELKNYVNSLGQQILTVSKANVEQYHDFTYFETTTSGIYVELTVVKQSTSRC
jgi:hypothetical protein